MNVLKAI